MKIIDFDPTEVDIDFELVEKQRKMYKSRKLRAKWNTELEMDLRAFHGVPQEPWEIIEQEIKDENNRRRTTLNKRITRTNTKGNG